MTNVKPARVRVYVLAAALCMAAAARSAEKPPPPPVVPVFENLQVFPKDIKPEQLIDEMHGFADGLGVTCNYCHAEGKPPAYAPPGEKLQFSLDTNPKKNIARQMLVMLRTVNAMVPAAVGKKPEQAMHLQCFNCHRGLPTPPLPLNTLLDKATAEKGKAAAIAQYKDLRQKNYGSAAYDFSASSLNGADVKLSGLDSYGLQLANAGKPDDALTWLNLNTRYFPKSTITWALIGYTQIQKKNKAAALEAIKKSIDLTKALLGGTLPAGHPLEALQKQAEAMP